MLYQTPAGYWLVGSQPLPLALGIVFVVVLGALSLDFLQMAFAAEDPSLA